MAKPPKDFKSTITLNGQTLKIRKHETDFTVLAAPNEVAAVPEPDIRRIGRALSRATAASAAERDQRMDEVRHSKVAHHVYTVDGTGEEILIDDRVIVELANEGTGLLEDLQAKFRLRYAGRVGAAHLLQLTDATAMNPVEAANRIAATPGVRSASPQVMLDMQMHEPPALFREQWYLTSGLMSHPDLLSGSDINAPEAWTVTKGDPAIVLAVIDDGFDLSHPAFSGVRRHPDARDFAETDGAPESEGQDYHGTCVASIAVGAHESGAMKGIAPGCTFLPVRIGFGPTAAPIDILEVFRYVSARADVVNCSFGIGPSSFDRFSAPFRAEITRLATQGGRRGKGLVFVFSAGNDDAPSFLSASQNVNGVRFVKQGAIQTIPAGSAVFSGYPMNEGVVVVGAMTSLKRKSGYSSWGPHLTVTAPSNNMHYITSFTPPGTPGRADFEADYRGLGQVAAVNRSGKGQPFSPIAGSDNPATPNLKENEYTRRFGGTSGAAPVVAGVAALMLSANPELTAADVRSILAATADAALDPALDLADDPNVQGLSGGFSSGKSLFFGAGKVDAARAVARARALNPAPGPDPDPDPEPAPDADSFHGEAAPDAAIPDNDTAGISSAILCPMTGRVSDILVEVDIRHSHRGDLRVELIAPGGERARLHNRTGGSSDDLRRAYAPAGSAALRTLIQARPQTQGPWTLSVADRAKRDRGRLLAWRLDLVRE